MAPSKSPSPCRSRAPSPLLENCRTLSATDSDTAQRMRLRSSLASSAATMGARRSSGANSGGAASDPETQCEDMGGDVSYKDRAVIRHIKQRPHLFTETLEENEELHARISELDAENLRLCDQVEELKARTRQLEEELCQSRCRSLSDDNEIQDVMDAAESFQKKVSRTESRARSAERRRVLFKMESSLEEKEQECHDVRRRLTESERKCTHLDTELAEVTQELDVVHGQRDEDQAVISRLASTVEQLKTTLESERQQFHDANAQQGPAQSASASASASRPPRPSNLAAELGNWSPPEPAPGVTRTLVGYLYKKSPATIRQFARPFQRRFVAVEGGKIIWWNKAQDYPDQKKCSGSLDFRINQCIVEADKQDELRFTLRPLEQLRVSGLLQNSQSNGTYQRAEFHTDPSVRYVKNDGDVPMFIYWSDRWHLGPDTEPENAVASKEGDDLQEDLVSAGTGWKSRKEDEKGALTATVDSAWSAGSFTGAHAGRVLEFSAASSEHQRSLWLECIQHQVALGRNNRVSMFLAGGGGVMGLDRSGSSLAVFSHTTSEKTVATYDL